MSNEVIIDGLNAHATLLESVREPYLGYVHRSRTAAVIREAIALLRTHPDAQPNEPLTLEELWEMDGKPIYVVDRVYPTNSGWWILGWTGADFVLAAAKRRGTQYIVQNYGIDWVAYRRPPKEA